MNDFLRNFLMVGIRDMVENGVALYQTYQYASGWYEKGVLLQADLEEIEELYRQKEELEKAVETEVTGDIVGNMEEVENSVDTVEETVEKTNAEG